MAAGYPPTPLGSPFPQGAAVTGTQQVAGGGPYSVYGLTTGYDQAALADGTGGYSSSTAVGTGSSMLGPAIQVIWSKEILFQAMPILRFEQFAVKKTELGVMPGLTVNFMRYNNLPIPAGPLVEGVRMKTYALSAQQYQIRVAEQGFAVSVTELLLNASFDDVMASASRLLGRNMALYLDTQARTSLQRSTSEVYGYQKPSAINTGYGIYERGTPGTYSTVTAGGVDNGYYLTMHTIKDAVEALASKNIPRLGETYVAFVHPHQSRRLRDTPEFIEVTKYAAPGNFMLGEIGRLNDVIFIETTQIGASLGAGPFTGFDPSVSGVYWRTAFDSTSLAATGGVNAQQPDQWTGGTTSGPSDAGNDYASVGPGVTQMPGWGQTWPASPLPSAFEALLIGDNAFGQAISLPVELRDGGVLDFGREHALAWYGIWGFGTITDSAVMRMLTN